MVRATERPAPSLEEFLLLWPEDVQVLLRATCALVREALPQAREAVYPGWKLVGYRVPHGKTSAYVGYVAPKAHGVQLGFEWGVLMRDPGDLLAGEGSQVRFVSISAEDQLEQALLIELIQEGARVVTSRSPDHGNKRSGRS